MLVVNLKSYTPNIANSNQLIKTMQQTVNVNQRDEHFKYVIAYIKLIITLVIRI